MKAKMAAPTPPTHFNNSFFYLVKSLYRPTSCHGNITSQNRTNIGSANPAQTRINSIVNSLTSTKAPIPEKAHKITYPIRIPR